MSGLNVLVVGASVAGPMTAYWLAKAGANVTVVERAPGLRTNGQSIDIRDSGVTIMGKIPGMEKMVRAKSTQEEGLRFVDDDDKVFATFAATGDPHNQSATSEFEIFRGDLARILYDLTKDNERIKYVFGDEIESMDHKDGASVRIEFANGYPAQEYDLVAVCDGATSRTRAMAFECSYREHLWSYNSWAAYFTSADNLLEGSMFAKWWNTTGGRAVFLRPDPAGTNRASLIRVGPNGPNNDITAPFRSAMKHGDDALKQHIIEHFKGTGWKTDELLKNMMTTTDFYASEIVQVRCPTLHKGRVVLVGDAGYCPSPFSGAGTTLAITGSYLLAGEIGACNGDVESGLQGYEEKVRPYITKYQGVPRSVVQACNPQTAWGLWIRTWVLTIMSRSSRIAQWGLTFVSAVLSNNKEHTVPEYNWVA